MLTLRVDFLVRVAVLLLLLISTRAFIWIWVEQAYVLSGADQAMARIFSLARWAVMGGLVFLILRGRFRPADLFAVWPILLFTAFVAVTFLWSAASMLDVIRGTLRYFGVLLMALALCHLVDEDRAFRRMLWVCVAFVVVNAAMLAAPHLAIHMSGPFSGQFRGAYFQKNLFGGIAANIFAFLFVFAVVSAGRPRRIAAAAAALCFLLLLWAGSKTAIAATVASAGVGLAAWAIVARRSRGAGRESAAFFFIMLALSIAFSVAAFGIVIELLNALDGVTFTGRTYLWDFVQRWGMERPWLGYGLEGFWRRFLEEEDALSRLGLWTIGSAHNGFLEAFLIGGFVGVAMVIAILGALFLQMVRLVMVGGSPRLVMLIAMILTQTIVLNMFETRITSSTYTDILFIGFCMILASRALKQAPRRTRPAVLRRDPLGRPIGAAPR